MIVFRMGPRVAEALGVAEAAGVTPIAAPQAVRNAGVRALAAASLFASSSSKRLAHAALAALTAWMLLESWGIATAIHIKDQGGWLAAAIAMIILLSALVSSIAGFAFSAIAGSALAYLGVEPVRAVQSMVVCSIATQCYAVWSIRKAIRWRAVVPLSAAGLMTVPLGVGLLLHANALFYASGLGAFLVGYGGWLALRREGSVARGHIAFDLAAGALGGLTGGLAGIPGAPVTIWCSLRGGDKLTQRAVYQPYILVMQIATLACLRWGTPHQHPVAHDLSLIPFALLGAMGGLAIFRRMTTRQFQIAVSILLLVSGLGLLGKAL
jgi:uncharacterized membrane protein YfcA